MNSVPPQVLAYSVNVSDVRAVDISADACQEEHLGDVPALLDEVDALRGELNTPSLLSLPQLPELERFASGWGRQLLPASWLTDPPESVVLVPHAFLHDLPLHLIRLNSGRPLCVESAVSVSSSLTSLRRALQRTDALEQGWTDPFFAIRRTRAQKTSETFRGRPESHNPDSGYSSMNRRWLAAGVDALGSNDELWRALPSELLQVFLRSTELEVAIEPEESLRDVIVKGLVGQHYDLIILAAHGYRNPLDALDNGLVMRAAQEPLRAIVQPICGKFSDGEDVPYVFTDFPARDLPAGMRPSPPADLLSVAELEHRRAHIDCPLVILLGCSTGRPVLYAGDQPQSLAEVFLHLGAAAVVAPMWDVRLSAARAWATAFMRALNRHSDSGRARASREACRLLHDQGAPLQDVGCLVLHGDYR